MLQAVSALPYGRVSGQLGQRQVNALPYVYHAVA